MRKVLILTNSQDAHARTVSECLIKKGAQPVRWFSEEFLFDQRVIHKMDLKDNFSLLYTSDYVVDLLDIDVVWFRRAGLPRLIKQISPPDHEFVKDENHMLMKSLWLTLGESAKWVNPYGSFERSNSKLLQLREAVRVGLRIPSTLITNEHEAVNNFIEENASEGTIYKTFFPACWEEEGSSFSLYTTSLSAQMLPDESIMALTPGIYQTAIKKQFEVRATFFDTEYVAVKIHNSDGIDWRALQNSSGFSLSPHVLPVEIEKRCIALMEKLGIVFGCFDFIVTPGGEYVFLEVNEMGQFLWIEQTLPDLHLLDKFCEFLLSKSKAIVNAEHNPLTLNEIIGLPSHHELVSQDARRYERFTQVL